MDRLYFIENIGCHDRTKGLVRIPDEHIHGFIKFIEDLNRNSTYGCMPVICVSRIDDESILREAVYEDIPEDIMQLKGKEYVFAVNSWSDEFKSSVVKIVEA